MKIQTSCIIYSHWEWHPMITMCYDHDAQYSKDKYENTIRTWIHTKRVILISNLHSGGELKVTIWRKFRVHTDGLVWDCGILRCYCTGDTTALDWTIDMIRPIIYTIGSCRPPVAMLVIIGGPRLHRMPGLIWVLLVLWLSWQWVSLWWPWLPHSEGGAPGIVWHLGWQTWTMLHLLHGATEGFR